MRFLSIGECMLELSPSGGDDLWSLNIAGDTFNTAWYVRRLVPEEIRVGYFTAVGQDASSSRMVDFIAASGLETDSILRHPTRTVGLYMISLSEGERTFSYWRNESAARTLADDEAALARAIDTADMVYFSGITVAILNGEARSRFFAAIRAAREAGKTIVFDSNIRPQLWASQEALRAGIMEAAALADIMLPSYDDEAEYFGDATPEDTARRYLGAGAKEVVVKNGAGSVLYADGEMMKTIDTDAVSKPLDTTGAGDSFNGGYLGARMRGQTPLDAVGAGQATARKVVMEHGALIKSTEIVL